MSAIFKIPPATANFRVQLAGLWSTQDLCELFHRTPMTITLWRRHKGLPVVIIPGMKRHSLRFVPEEIINWASRNNITTYQSQPRYRSPQKHEQVGGHG